MMKNLDSQGSALFPWQGTREVSFARAADALGVIAQFPPGQGFGYITLDDGRSLSFGCERAMFTPKPGDRVRVWLWAPGDDALGVSATRNGLIRVEPAFPLVSSGLSGPSLADTVRELASVAAFESLTSVVPNHLLDARGPNDDLLLWLLLRGWAGQKPARGIVLAEDSNPSLRAIADLVPGFTLQKASAASTSARGFAENVKLTRVSWGSVERDLRDLEKGATRAAQLASVLNGLLGEGGSSWRICELQCPVGGPPALVGFADRSERDRVAHAITPWNLAVHDLPVATNEAAGRLASILDRLASGSVDWAALEHARGNASDVPERLAARASANWDLTSGGVEGWLVDQGTLYDAAIAALPELVALVVTPETPHRKELAREIAQLAITGRQYAEFTLEFNVGGAVLRALAMVLPRLAARLGIEDDRDTAKALVVAAAMLAKNKIDSALETALTKRPELAELALKASRSPKHAERVLWPEYE